MIADTLRGNAIDFFAKRLGLYYQAAFNIRHKILMALQELPDTANVCLRDVSEFDETFVLDCYKGKEPDTGVGRNPRKHGAKSLKSGISSEYLCICTGIQRKGEAFAATRRNAESIIGRLEETVLAVTGASYYHSNKDVRTAGVLVVI